MVFSVGEAGTDDHHSQAIALAFLSGLWFTSGVQGESNTEWLTSETIWK